MSKERDIQVAAAFAEVLVDPGYLEARNNAFEANSDPEAYFDQKVAAEELIVNSFRRPGRPAERDWETRRQSVLVEVHGTGLGAFNDYLHKSGGEAKPTDLSVADLDSGQPEVIRTNSQILSMNQLHEDPIDFMDSALLAIEHRIQTTPNAVGPENYATALKFFADKFIASPTSHLDPAAVKDVVNRSMEGFVRIAAEDQPNFVEMTNLYFAIRELPAGAFDKKFSGEVVAHSLEQLPTYNSRTLALMNSALGKLDLSETGPHAAALLDLGLRKQGGFEKTADMLYGIRAVANLPKSPAAERAFATFLDIRNNLEEPMQLEDLDMVNYSLHTIVRDVIEDGDLSHKAKDLAFRCADQAVRLYKTAQRSGNITPTELERIKLTVQRIGYNYTQI